MEQQTPREKELEDALVAAFTAMGRAGANHDTSHPLRAAWEQARRVLAQPR